MRPNVFIVGDIEAGPIAEMFRDEGWYVCETIRQASLVQFTGGHDLTPAMYQQKQHESTWCWPNRDAYEYMIFELCEKYWQPMAGICRGGQFLNVMSGGGMWQDVDGHSISGMHWADCKVGGDKIMVSSVHHQMMIPSTKKKDVEIAMTARCASYKERLTAGGKLVKIMNDQEDVEACYYKNTGSLCFQPHPEYRHIAGIQVCRDRYFDYLDHFFNLRA